MLRRAGAEPGKLNELGMNSLGMACMFNAPEPRRRAHLALVQWLIDHGAGRRPGLPGRVRRAFRDVTRSSKVMHF